VPYSLFISDLHLSDNTPAIESGLLAFLKREQAADALYILGDLFEAWVGDDDDAPLAQRIRDALAAYSAGGTNVFFLRGNRDFLLGERFASDIGATLLDDYTTVDVGGEAALLMHGDLLCTDDTDYLQFRAMVHDPNWQTAALSKPLDERRQLARQLRAMSADAASNKPEDIMDVNADAVNKAMADAGVQRLIHGHTHRPARHNIATGERIVLGDWGKTGWCLRAKGSVLSLEEFAL
jgi:UDP-2,3-diacylglucosamine hydrolase